MVLILTSLLVNSLIAQYTEDVVSIHEWGVIEVDQEWQSAVGAAMGNVDAAGSLQPIELYAVEAPVVWFHGPACTGTLTVFAKSGFVTTAVPWYDSVIVEEATDQQPDGSQTVSWLNLSIASMEQQEELMEDYGSWSGFEYALPYWRGVQSNSIFHPRSGYDDNFLYYECSFRDMTTFARGMYGYQGTYLLFFMEDSDLVCVKSTTVLEMDVRGPTVDDEALLGTLSLWSEGELQTDELQALWDTWRPAIRYRCSELGQTVMLFPISEGQVESICSLDFQPDGDYEVEYHRLFLGLGRI